MNTDFAINTIKLRRILDKMPNATEAEIKAEYIKQGGLLNKEETTVEILYVSPMVEVTKKLAKKTVTKKVKEVVKKVAKKVTKKK